MNPQYPELRDLFYIFNGIGYTFQITIYRDVYEYLSDRAYSEAGLKEYPDIIHDVFQRSHLKEIIQQIQKITNDTDDQVRIAVSLVQHIPYDHRKCIDEIDFSPFFKIRSPYEVIYDSMGICSEKSILLAFILKELGYGTALFSFNDERHMTVGIKAPKEYSFCNTGYAFIETTIVSIINSFDNLNPFSLTGHGSIKIGSFPTIIIICDGASFDTIFREFFDYEELKDIKNNHVHEGSTYYLMRYNELIQKYGL